MGIPDLTRLIALSLRVIALVVTMLAKMFRLIIVKISIMIVMTPIVQDKSSQTKETSLVIGTSRFP
ncbi:membrane protein [Gordonia phage Burley]|nr:hypothetical protein SEA_RUNHAAR_4 [Gordonia phage Runhaar]USH44665.1 membrane protein [Gordonia phage Burley]WAB10389.1 hypothetical protein SEA_PHEPPER_4 [Gordonia phage Phepper]